MSFQLVLPFIFEEAPCPAKISYEYFVLISPDESIQMKTRSRKKELHAEIGISRENLISKAHISLFRFMDIQDEAQIRERVQRALEDVAPFVAETDRPMVFDHGLKQSLVLTFKEPEPVKQLSRLLAGEFGHKSSVAVPHITIARSIHVRDLSRISNLQNYFFSGSFVCNKVTILRRPLNKRAGYELFDEIELYEAKEFCLQEHLGLMDYRSAS